MRIIYQPATPKQQFYLYFIVGIILIGLWPIYMAYLSPVTFPLDDAYIVLHNAQVLHWGYDPNYVGVPALFGSSSILHTLLVSLFLFWLTPPKALLLVQWLSDIVYALGLLRLAFVLNAAIWQIITVLLISFTAGFMSYHLLSGLDTTLAMAGIVWSLAFASQPVTLLLRIALACICGILPSIRPELGLWSIYLLCYQAYRYWKLKPAFLLVIYQLIQDCLLAGLCAIPCLLIYWLNTGLFLPSTMQSKVAFNAYAELPFLTKLSRVETKLSIFITQINYLSVLGMLSLLWLTALGRTALLFICSFLAFYIHYFGNGIANNYERYLYPLLPLLMYGLLIGLAQQDKIIRIGARILLMLLLIQAVWQWPRHWQEYYDSRTYTLTELANVARWSQANIPSNAILLVHDAGYIAFATHFQLIDMVGLKTPQSVYFHQRLTFPSTGKNRLHAVDAIMQATHVKFIIAKRDWCELLNIPNGLIHLGWHLKLIRSAENGFLIYQVYK